MYTLCYTFQVEIHKREVDELLHQVEEIEQENLGIMSELFECTVDDLKISRYSDHIVVNTDIFLLKSEQLFRA